MLIDSLVGKLGDVSTELRRGFYNDRREDWCFPTIDVCNFSGRDWKVQLSDTPGLEAFRLIREMLYPGTDVFVVCYDMCSKHSLSNIQHFFQNEFKPAKDLAPVILCGCKYDHWLALEQNGREGPNNLRKVAQVTVPTSKATYQVPVSIEQVAKEINAVFNIFTSSKTGYGVSREAHELMWHIKHDPEKKHNVAHKPLKSCPDCVKLEYLCRVHRVQRSGAPAAFELNSNGGFDFMDHVLFAATANKKHNVLTGEQEANLRLLEANAK